MPPLGSYIYFGKNLIAEARRAVEMGAETFVVHPASQVMRDLKIEPAHIAALGSFIKEAKLVTPIMHASRLTNLMLPDGKFARKADKTITDKSIRALISDLSTADKISIRWVIIEVDSKTKESALAVAERVAGRINHIFAQTAGLSAGIALVPPAFGKYESSFEYIGFILNHIEDHSRISVALNPNRYYTASPDIDKVELLTAMMREFEARIGVSRLSSIIVESPLVPKYLNRMKYLRDEEYYICRFYVNVHTAIQFYRPLFHDPRLGQVSFMLPVFQNQSLFRYYKGGLE